MSETNSLPSLVAAVVLVEQDGEYLLEKESKPECRNLWSLPGGRAIVGESILQTAIREVLEETGLDINLTGLLYVDQRIGTGIDGSDGRVRFVFLGRPVGGKLKQTEDEHSICAGWFSEEEIKTLELRNLFVRKVIEIHRQNPTVLPIAKIHPLTPDDLLQERP